MYLYVYTYIHIYIHYMHACMHTYIQTYTHTYKHIHTYTHTHTHTHTLSLSHTHIHTHTPASACHPPTPPDPPSLFGANRNASRDFSESQVASKLAPASPFAQISPMYTSGGHTHSPRGHNKPRLTSDSGGCASDSVSVLHTYRCSEVMRQ